MILLVTGSKSTRISSLRGSDKPVGSYFSFIINVLKLLPQNRLSFIRNQKKMTEGVTEKTSFNNAHQYHICKDSILTFDGATLFNFCFEWIEEKVYY